MDISKLTHVERLELVKDPKTPIHECKKLLRDPNANIRYHLTLRKDIPEDWLRLLRNDRDKAVEYMAIIKLQQR